MLAMDSKSGSKTSGSCLPTSLVFQLSRISITGAAGWNSEITIYSRFYCPPRARITGFIERKIMLGFFSVLWHANLSK